MKAVCYERYGPPKVLHLKEVEKPFPKAHEVLVKVQATTVNYGDVRMRRFIVPRWQWLFARLYLGIRTPKRPILGMELAGIVEAVGNQVTQFRPGDPVFASTFNSDFGGYAEYKCLPEDGLIVSKPNKLTFQEAAAGIATGGMTALRLLRIANIKNGQKILIYGASGSVGTYAVQLAKHFGAHVTGVCSTSNLELVKSIGADEVVDYTKADITQLDLSFDVVFDAVDKLNKGKKLLKESSTYLNVTKSSGALKTEDLVFLKDLIVTGKIHPVIDRVYSLEQIVEAHRYVEKGHKKGNVVLTLESRSAHTGTKDTTVEVGS